MITHWLQTHLLTFLVFAPFLLGVLLMAFPRRQAPLTRLLGLMGSLGILAVAAYQLLAPASDLLGRVYVERSAWFTVQGIPVDYHLAVDGLNLWLFLLTALLVPLTLLGTWDSIAKRPGTAVALVLMLEAGILGALVAQDLLVFYLFWEAMLVPLFFLIGLFGGEDRRYAAIKFILFTLAGSLLWLVALLYLGGQAHSFAPAIMGQAAMALSAHTQALLFLAFSLAFAIKVPLFPLHTWLPDAHTEAPTAGSVLLAGVLLKLGSYGFVRFALPMFPGPTAHFARPLAILSVIAIVYGALVAMGQKDLKRLVAYSSVSHMGFVMLGLASLTVIGTQGAMLQMLNHGISTGALFLLVGMVYDRTHTRQIADYGGLATRMPVFTTFFLIVTLSSIGLPLTNGFVGEFLILNGVFSVPGWGPALACVATLGILLGAVYMLWMFKRIFWGPVVPDGAVTHIKADLNLREVTVLVPLVIAIFWAGLHPQTFLGHSEGAVRRSLALIQASAPAPRALPPVLPPVLPAPSQEARP